MIYYFLMIGFNLVFTVLFHWLIKKTKFGSWKFILQQVIIGVVFGIFGCIATEYGCMVQVPLSNVRDSFPLTAGLLFGGPSGIIAGFISGIYRFFSPTLIAGSYTRLSCTITTILAGIIAALMRKFFFKKKCPTVFLAFLFVISIEAFHMAMIFLTHVTDLAGAFDLVRRACVKVTVANSLSVSLAVILFRLNNHTLFVKGKVPVCGKEKKTVSGFTTFGIMFSLIGVFVFVILFLFAIHTGFSRNTMKGVFIESLNEVKDNIINREEHCLTKKKLINTKNENVPLEDILMELQYYDNYLVDDIILAGKSDFCVYGDYWKVRYDIEDDSSENNNIVFPFKKKSEPGKLYNTDFCNKNIYYMYDYFSDYYIVATVEKDSIMFFRDSTVYMLVLLNIITFSILFFSIYILLKTNVISNMRSLIEAMVKLRGKNYHISSDLKPQYFMSITEELNYTFELLYKHYDELNGQMIIEQEKKKEFEYKAEHDKLTGLLNREGFKKTVCMVTESNVKIGLLVIDVDKFKEINDTFGHIIGDKILQKIAKCLKDNSRSGDIVMRYGGDEFALILAGCSINEKDMVIGKINLINEKLGEADGELPAVSISVGAAFSENGYNKDLFQQADEALYITKKNGRGGCTVWSKDL